MRTHADLLDASLVCPPDRFADDERGAVAPGALWDALARGDHFLARKVSYWLPVGWGE